jgi:choline monooxygenase
MSTTYANVPLEMPGETVRAIPALWYHDPDTFRRERKRIFAREWLWVGLEHQLAEPHGFITAEPAGFPVLVRRCEDGAIRGFHNVCRHRASKLLLDPHGQCERLVCPYHGWRYGPEGELVNAPRFEAAQGFEAAALGLYPIRVETWMGLVFINLDPDSVAFSDWFGPVKDRVEDYVPTPRVYHGDIFGEADCNWKNYVDNYQEGYHIPLVHPQLAGDVNWKDYRVTNVPGGSIHQCEARKGSGQPGLFGWKFPNFMFNTYGNGLSFMRIEPLGPRRCRVFYSHFRPADESPETYQREVVAYGWRISEEDQWLVPDVQKNLEAGVYEAGPLSPRHENGVWYFHELLRTALR